MVMHNSQHLKTDCHEFEASQDYMVSSMLGYRVRSYPKKESKKKNKTNKSKRNVKFK